MDANILIRERIAAEAAEWFVRLQDANTERGVREEFTHWLLCSAAHVEEYLAVVRVWSDARLASGDEFSTERLILAAQADDAAPNVIELSRGRDRGSHEVETPRGRPRMRERWAAAVGFLVIAALVSVWLNERPDRVETAVGEQRTFVLGDGSVVYVNTDTELTIDLQPHERRIALARGEARFDVAKDPRRPFIVSTPQASVRAVGTSFNVRTVLEGTAVAVLEGRVEVKGNHAGARSPAQRSAAESVDRPGTNAASLQVAAGERVAITNAGDIVPRAGPPLERVLAWTERRLEFRDEPLATVVAEFNRYNAQPLYVADPVLASHRISGSFAIHDVASLLQFLERYQHVQIESGADGSRLLKRRPEPPESI